jgi:hypothetical protein
MQILASFELPKFCSEGRPAREGASRKGARPCPQRESGVVRNSHTFPYDTNCIDQPVQGAWAVSSGAIALCGRTSRLRSSPKYVHDNDCSPHNE